MYAADFFNLYSFFKGSFINLCFFYKLCTYKVDLLIKIYAKYHELFLANRLHYAYIGVKECSTMEDILFTTIFLAHLN